MGKPGTAARINVMHVSDPDYAGVQEQILGAITRHLKPEEFSTSVRHRVEGRLNFSLFIGHRSDVLMSHGLADKNYFWRKDRDGERSVHRFEHVFVPGEWLKRRIVRSKKLEVPRERIHVVGWPRLDVLFQQQQELAQQPREPGARPKVLWAPTHDYARRGENNDSNSSYPELLEFVPLFEKHFDFAMSLHPRNRPDKKPTQHSLLDCDYVISDFGTIVYEAWALGKPVIFPHWLIGDRIKQHLGRSAEAHIFHERLGLHADNPQQMIDFVMDGAGIDDRTTTFINDWLDPTYAGRSGERVADLLRTLSQRPSTWAKLRTRAGRRLRALR